MSKSQQPSVPERWARFRFAVVGALLAAPPAQGQLRAELEAFRARQTETVLQATLPRASG